MKKINEGNVYNVETSKPKKDRSSELDDVSNILMGQFWEAMGRQGISKDKAKVIAKQTFGSNINP
jgi:hypothetical protein